MLSPDEALSPPECCDVCRSDRVRLLKTRSVYSKQQAEWPYRYHCRDCGASVGCHPHTLMPLGLMASRKMRRLRVKCHQAFDPLWKAGIMPRSAAYAWLAGTLGMTYAECHISVLTEEQLHIAIEASTRYYNDRLSRIERERMKNEKRAIRQRQQHRRHVKRRKAVRPKRSR